MKKGQNSEGSSCLFSQTTAGNRSFTLPKSKILRGRTNFDRLFSSKAIVFKKSSVRIRFCIYNRDESDCKMAFIVPKRLGKAVYRKKMKRRLKEAYRLNQYILIDEVASAGCVFHGALMAAKINVEYDVLEPNVVNLLKQTKSYISKMVE